MGCLSHKTAVAAGALSQYLRFMVNPGPEQYRQFVRVDGINYMLHYVGGHEHQFGHNQPDAQVLKAQQSMVGANGVLGQIKPPMALMKRDDDNDEAAGEIQDEQQGEEIEIPDQGMEQQNKNQIIDENDETIHVDPNEDKNEENEEYEEDDNYDDKNGDEGGNYLDNKNNENNNDQEGDKYDDGNYDENEQKRQKLAAQNQVRINPKFQRHIDLNLQDQVKGRGDDKEYEQYIDEEELVNNNEEKGTKPKLQGQNVHGLQIPDVQPRHFDGREQNDDADQGYNYYVNKDDNEDEEEKLADLAQDKKINKSVYPKKKAVAKANLPYFSGAQNSNHVGKAYLLLLITMFGLMYLMYRFIKQRRVIIKYPHRGYYR